MANITFSKDGFTGAAIYKGPNITENLYWHSANSWGYKGCEQKFLAAGKSEDLIHLKPEYTYWGKLDSNYVTNFKRKDSSSINPYDLNNFLVPDYNGIVPIVSTAISEHAPLKLKKIITESCWFRYNANRKYCQYSLTGSDPWTDIYDTPGHPGVYFIMVGGGGAGGNSYQNGVLKTAYGGGGGGGGGSFIGYLDLKKYQDGLDLPKTFISFSCGTGGKYSTDTGADGGDGTASQLNYLTSTTLIEAGGGKGGKGGNSSLHSGGSGGSAGTGPQGGSETSHIGPFYSHQGGKGGDGQVGGKGYDVGNLGESLPDGSISSFTSLLKTPPSIVYQPTGWGYGGNFRTNTTYAFPQNVITGAGGGASILSYRKNNTVGEGYILQGYGYGGCGGHCLFGGGSGSSYSGLSGGSGCFAVLDVE